MHICIHDILVRMDELPYTPLIFQLFCVNLLFQDAIIDIDLIRNYNVNLYQLWLARLALLLPPSP